jgi:predicted ABC-type transport system involved in lysophospholipase L1 biosynthesis ATPase subunit
VADLLSSLRRDRGCTLVVVTHNPLMASHADTHYALRDGRLTEVAMQVADPKGRSGYELA